jgi:basic membrane protein A and related proteins
MKPRALVVLALVAVPLAAASGAAEGRSRLRIGLVFQTTAVTGAYQQGAFAGLQRAVKELGVEAKTVVPGPRQNSYVPSFSYLARQKYDLIIALGFLEVGDLDTVARRFPVQTFALIDSSQKDLKHHPKNVRGSVFRTEQAAYLAGYLAALMEERRPGKDVISAVGGFPIPTVDAYIAGYRAGARRADPGISTMVAYSHDFLDPAKCKTVALDQIARGSGAVFNVAGGCGLGALSAAKEKHVWGIGVDTDQSSLGPHILTSVVKRLDVAVFSTVKAFQEGRFRTPGDTFFELRGKGVGLGKVSPRVPRAYLRVLDRIRAQIVAGTIRVPSTLRR